MKARETSKASKVVAIVGSMKSGKTSLLESILMIGGRLGRKGLVEKGNTVGDPSAEAKNFQMSTEVSVASLELDGQCFSFLDCPGSIEFFAETQQALMAADIAVVVCEPNQAKIQTLSPLLHFLDQRKIPHLLFVNKVSDAQENLSNFITELQQISSRPLVLRELPLQENERTIGFVDLVSEKAYKFQSESTHPSLIQIPSQYTDREKSARTGMLEALADYNDELLVQILEDAEPASDDIISNFIEDVAADKLVPVLFGDGLHDYGVAHLINVLIEDTPDISNLLLRRGLVVHPNDTQLQIFKNLFIEHVGRVSLARLLQGDLPSNQNLAGSSAQIDLIDGYERKRAEQFSIGSIVALSKSVDFHAGDLVNSSHKILANDWPESLPSLYQMAVKSKSSSDDMKLTEALHKLIDEDCGLSISFDQCFNELILLGQGPLHLDVARFRLEYRQKIQVELSPPHVPYRETIKRPAKVQGRHKKQNGGHGQFGNVCFEIKPLSRGEGIRFTESISGGVIPKNYFAAIESGIRKSLARGPNGYPIIDLSVNLYDGSYHRVDSSDYAFEAAASTAIQQAVTECEPTVLEPIHEVALSIPRESLAAAQKLIAGKRGQILGFDNKPGWKDWIILNAYIPKAEMHDLISQLRSLSQGVGFFTDRFSYLQEQQNSVNP